MTPSTLSSATNTKWTRRFLELRRPYLHIYTVEGDEINAINLSNCRIDHNPSITRLLGRDGTPKKSAPANGGLLGALAGWAAATNYAETANSEANVFAIYTPQNSYILRCRTERDKIEWILKIDQSYFSNDNSGDNESSEESESESESESGSGSGSGSESDGHEPDDNMANDSDGEDDDAFARQRRR
jgi:hypothetical protein